MIRKKKNCCWNNKEKHLLGTGLLNDRDALSIPGRFSSARVKRSLPLADALIDRLVPHGEQRGNMLRCKSILSWWMASITVIVYRFSSFPLLYVHPRIRYESDSLPSGVSLIPASSSSTLPVSFTVPVVGFRLYARVMKIHDYLFEKINLLLVRKCTNIFWNKKKSI